MLFWPPAMLSVSPWSRCWAGASVHTGAGVLSLSAGKWEALGGVRLPCARLCVRAWSARLVPRRRGGRPVRVVPATKRFLDTSCVS